MSLLSDLVSVAESALGAPTAANLANDALAVAETIAPAPVVAGINTVKTFLGTPLGKEIEAALGSFITHVIGGTNGSVLAEPVTDTVATKASS